MRGWYTTIKTTHGKSWYSAVQVYSIDRSVFQAIYIVYNEKKILLIAHECGLGLLLLQVSLLLQVISGAMKCIDQCVLRPIREKEKSLHERNIFFCTPVLVPLHRYCNSHCSGLILLNTATKPPPTILSPICGRQIMTVSCGCRG